MTGRPAKRFTTLAASALLLALAGCGGGDDGGVTNPTPTSPTHTESEPNDVTPQLLGALGGTDFVIGGASSGNTDVDLYRLTLPSASNLHVTLAWTGGANLGLAMLDTTLALFHQQDTGANPEQMSHDNFPAGDWVLRVTSGTASSASYTLTVGKH